MVRPDSKVDELPDWIVWVLYVCVFITVLPIVFWFLNPNQEIPNEQNYHSIKTNASASFNITKPATVICHLDEGYCEVRPNG